MGGPISSCYASCFGMHIARRRFLGGFAAGLAAVTAPQTASASQVTGYPPPPPLGSAIEGAIDFHVHSAPDVFGRAVTDIEVAQAAVAAKMRAIVLKNHVTMTADRAWLVSKAVPGLQVFGGVVAQSRGRGDQSRCRRVDVPHGRSAGQDRVDADF